MQKMPIKTKSKAQLVRDIRDGMIELRMLSDRPFEEQPWYCRIFRKPTKVNEHGIFFGKSMIPFPKKREDLFYTDRLLAIRVNGRQICYSVKTRQSR